MVKSAEIKNAVNRKEVAMKFLLIVLAIHFIVKVLIKKENKSNVHHKGMTNCKVRHPAEYELR